MAPPLLTPHSCLGFVSSDFRAALPFPDTQEGSSRGSWVNALLAESPLKEDFQFLQISVKIVWKSPLQDVCIPGVLEMLPVYFLGQSLVPGGTKEEALETLSR